MTKSVTPPPPHTHTNVHYSLYLRQRRHPNIKYQSEYMKYCCLKKDYAFINTHEVHVDKQLWGGGGSICMLGGGFYPSPFPVLKIYVFA